jgi:hypothetical protein
VGLNRFLFPFQNNICKCCSGWHTLEAVGIPLLRIMTASIGCF